MKNLPCIGLFGTCGASRWRDPFIAAYRERGIRYFNPQVDNWTPELADIEAQHLKRDEIVLFPITGETYGTGSLAETGFSLLQAVSSNSTRFVVYFIEAVLDEALAADPVAHQESLRARRLVTAHLRENVHPNAFVAASLDDMLDTSLRLHAVVNELIQIRDPSNRPRLARSA